MSEDLKVKTYDNTALNNFQTCQKKYEYFIRSGIVPPDTSEPLAFGIALHAGREKYQLLTMSGVTHLDASDAAVRRFTEVWDEEMPARMKVPTKVSDRRGKNNGTRLLLGYLGKYGSFTKPLHIEVPFAVHIGRSPGGEDVLVSGIIDEICEFNGQTYVLDLKTSSYEPDGRFFSAFHTSSQMMGYVHCVEETLGIPIAGAMIHAVWVRSIGSVKPRKVSLPDHFRADVITYTPEQLDEWKTNVLHTVDDIKSAEKRNYFRFNWGDACKNYGGCEYVKICGATPLIRPQIINNDYKRSTWNPLGADRVTK